ncbi:MAG: hypothetical protein RLZZ628_1191 [Bacteroidota bacterium]|jgi:D-amino-acid dehydrogenase
MKNFTSVVMVGAGIVNLMSAYRLCKQGFDVCIFDKAKNPFQDRQWRQQGATFGGENARMFSLTEADNYNEKKSAIYKDMTHLFETKAAADGWSVIDHYGCSEREWIDQFKSVPATDAYQYADEIYAFTRQAGDLWEALIQNEPSLFEQTHLKRDIVRLYSEVSDFKAAQKLHKRLDSFMEVLEGKSLDYFYPEGNNKEVRPALGGIMKVRGFTLQIHDFCANLIAFLEQKGVQFHWESPCLGIEKNQKGEIAGIQIKNEWVTATHYIFSLGAYSGHLYQNTKSNNKIHGVLGIWMTLPNVYGLEHSFKIHKNGHVAEDSNVTVVEEKGQKKLVFGAGYGYVGNIEANTVDLNALQPIYDSLWQTAKIYFPAAYHQGVQEGLLQQPQKYCTRPFTTTGLGIFEVVPTEKKGRMILSGGHNTGGFTQAPIVAQAVLDTLQHKTTSMQDIYHPMKGLSMFKNFI